jgi:hypothetical protein
MILEEVLLDMTLCTMAMFEPLLWPFVTFEGKLMALCGGLAIGYGVMDYLTTTRKRIK